MRPSTQIEQLILAIGLAISASACQKSTQVHTSYSATSSSSGSASETVNVRSAEPLPIEIAESEDREREEPDRNSIHIENRSGSHSGSHSSNSSVRVDIGNGDSSSYIFNSTRSSGSGRIFGQNTDGANNRQFISIGSHQLEFNYDLQSEGVNLSFDLWQDGDRKGENPKVTAEVRTPTGQIETIDLQFDRGQKRKTVFIPGRELGLYQVTVEAQMEGGEVTNSFTFDRQ